MENKLKLYFYNLRAFRDHCWYGFMGYIFAPDRERASALLVQKFVYDGFPMQYDALHVETLYEQDVREGTVIDGNLFY